MILKRILGAGAVAAVMLLIPAAASATTLYPAGDTISFGNSPGVSISGTDCTLFIPPVTFTNSSGSGTVTNTIPNYDVRFDNCYEMSGDVKAIGPTGEGGNWTLGIDYGMNTVSLGVPTGGLAIATNGSGDSGCTWTNTAPRTFTGYWDNGYGAPVNAPTNVTVPSGQITMTAEGSWGSNGCALLGTNQVFYVYPEGDSSFFTLTDTTNPNSLPLLGP